METPHLHFIYFKNKYQTLFASIECVDNTSTIEECNRLFCASKKASIYFGGDGVYFKGRVGQRDRLGKKTYTYRQSKERNNPPSDPYMLVQGYESPTRNLIIKEK